MAWLGLSFLLVARQRERIFVIRCVGFAWLWLGLALMSSLLLARQRERCFNVRCIAWLGFVCLGLSWFVLVSVGLQACVGSLVLAGRLVKSGSCKRLEYCKSNSLLMHNMVG